MAPALVNLRSVTASTTAGTAGTRARRGVRQLCPLPCPPHPPTARQVRGSGAAGQPDPLIVPETPQTPPSPGAGMGDLPGAPCSAPGWHPAGMEVRWGRWGRHHPVTCHPTVTHHPQCQHVAPTPSRAGAGSARRGAGSATARPTAATAATSWAAPAAASPATSPVPTAPTAFPTATSAMVFPTATTAPTRAPTTVVSPGGVPLVSPTRSSQGAGMLSGVPFLRHALTLLWPWHRLHRHPVVPGALCLR